MELAKKVKLGIAMELCEMGSLFKQIQEARDCHLKYGGAGGAQPDAAVKRRPGWLLYSNWRLRLEVAKGVAAGLEYMHAMGVLHCDLTSYNILLSDTRCAAARFSPFFSLFFLFLHAARGVHAYIGICFALKGRRGLLFCGHT